MNRRIDLNDIRLLMYVIEHGSYTAAARAIGVPKSTISQRIAQLEATVGTGLLRRTSRRFSLTEAGTQMLPHARAIEDLARQVEQLLMDRGSELQGTLRVSCSQAIAQLALSLILPRFLELHPKVSIRVETTDRMVDLIGEGFDMALRGHIGQLRDSILVQRVVARSQWVLTASPAWLKQHGSPATPKDIVVAETLSFLHQPDPESWTLSRGAEQVTIALAPRLIHDDMLSLRASTIADGGIACLPGAVVAAELDAGVLVEVLPDWRCQTSTISVLTPPKLQSSRLATAFSAFLAAKLPAMMRYQPGDPALPPEGGRDNPIIGSTTAIGPNAVLPD